MEEAMPLCGRIKIRCYDMGEAMTLVGGLKLIWESNLISCFFAKYFSILWGGMAVYDTL